ncbi:hypothetical protein ACS0TY_014282 [Phlomoides rotata]
MNTQLVEIQPRELKFTFELKKQSSCAVHLANVTDQYVAFKVKTTSPKKYCVRPNVGIIKPKSTYDFTVTMQAQKSAPSEMHLKDKFLIQSTVIPFGTSEDEITPSMFTKAGLKYIEETKLRVVLTSPPNSPTKPQADVIPKQEASYETLMLKEPHLLPVNGFNNQEPIPSYETKMPKDNLQNRVENTTPPDLLTKQVEAFKIVKMEESQSLKVTDNKQSISAKDEEFYVEKAKQVKDLEESKSMLMKEIEDLRSKISTMDSKLVEAQYTIEKLKIEKSNTYHEKETLKPDLAISSTKISPRKIQVGFPPLFVCMVALISLMIGSYF